MLKRIKIHNIPFLAAFSAGAIFSIVLLVLIFLPRFGLYSQQNKAYYGNALAKMAAIRATDAALNHDLVSLQVILKDVVANPNILLATIHDVENKLLVQAGERFGDKNSASVYSAPIIVHDSIAGYVSVTTEQHDLFTSLLMLVLLLTGALLCIFFWAMYDAKSLYLIPREDNKNALTPDSSSSPGAAENNADKDEDTDINTHEQPICYCHLSIHNLSVLQQQLNDTTLDNTINQFEQMIIDVLALYSGQSFEEVDNKYILSFYSIDDGIEEVVFNGICSAYLLRSISSITNNIPLDLGFFITDSPEHNELIKTPAIVVDASITCHPEVHSRFTLIDFDDDSRLSVLTDVKSPYLSLLENQRKQLINRS